MRYLYATILLCCPYPLTAQWGAVSILAPLQNHAVHFTDASNGYLAANGDIKKSTTGGTSWNAAGFTGAEALYHAASDFRSIHVFDMNTVVVAGVNYGDNAELVIRTINGGTNWSIVHLGPSGSGFGDMHFPTDTRGYAVGKDGMIFRSNDAGATWAQQANANTVDLNGVYFFDADHGVAVGDHITLRTSNGGNTWQATGVGEVLSGIEAIDADNWIACGGDNGVVLRSSDAGASWQDISLPIASTLSRVSIYDADHIFIAGGGEIFVTNDQGAHWERYPLGFNVGYVNDIFVPAALGGTGYAVSQDGRVFKTTSVDAPAHPIPLITADTLGACPGGVLDFAAPTLSGYSWQWSIDDVPVGTNNTLSHVFLTPNNHTVTLAVSNGSFTEEVDAQVFITPLPVAPTFTVTSSVAHPCSQSITSLIIPNAPEGSTYRRTVNGIATGGSFNGNNGQLTFSSVAVAPGQSYGIRAYKENACGIDSSTVLAPFIVLPLGDATLPLYAVPPLLCGPSVVELHVDQSEPDITYQLFHLGFDVGTPVTGTGGTLVFPTDQVTSDMEWTVRTANADGCGLYLTDTARVDYDPMEATFTVSDPFPIVGQTITVQDATSAVSYAWQLGDNATPATSTTSAPSATYAISGPDTLAVIMHNSSGCLDTMAMEIQVHAPAPEGLGHVCWAELTGKQGGDRWDQGAYRVLDTHISVDGSTYATGFFFQDYSFYDVYNMFLLKFAPDGHLLWEHAEDAAHFGPQNYYGSFGTSLTSDAEGNVYLGGSFCANNFNLGPFQFPNESQISSLFIDGYIAKLDSSGTYQWVMHAPTGSLWVFPTGCSSLTYVDDSHIYGVWRVAGSEIIGGDGISAFQTEAGASQLIHFDNDGHIHGIHGFGPDPNVAGNFGEGIFNPNLDHLYSGKVVLAGPRVKAGPGGKLFIAGTFPRGGPDGQTGLTIQVGPYAVSAPNDNVDQNGYMAVYDTAGGWVNGFRTWSTVNTFAPLNDERMFPVFAPDAYGNVLVVFNWLPNEFPATYANEDQLGDGTDVTSDSGAVFMKYGPDGDLQWYTKHSGFQASDVEWDGVYFNVIGQYERALSLESDPPSMVGVDALGSKDMALIQVTGDGEVTSVRPFASAGVDRSFDMEIHPCGGVQFMGYAGANCVVDGIQLHGTDNELYLMRYDTDGDCAGTVCAPISLRIPDPVRQSDVMVFPNPSTSLFTFQGEGLQHIEIMDAQGRPVTTIRARSGASMQWNAQGQAPGLYVARILRKNGRMEVVRLVRSE